jgi:hypothetical protein
MLIQQSQIQNLHQSHSPTQNTWTWTPTPWGQFYRKCPIVVISNDKRSNIDCLYNKNQFHGSVGEAEAVLLASEFVTSCGNFSLILEKDVWLSLSINNPSYF